MSFRWMFAAGLCALAPAAALAFEAVDLIPYPSRGGFPEAYPADPVYPTRLSAEVGLMYDNNPFRLPPGADTRALLGKDERSDALMRYGVELRHIARIWGRQSARLHARAEYNDYLRYSVLDHFAYVLTGEWLWEVTNNFSGTLGWDRSHGLSDPGEAQRPISDKVTFDRFYATGGYRVSPDWRVRGGAERRTGERSGDRAGVSTDANSVHAGIDYTTALANAIGVEARRTEGDAPVGPLLDPTGQFGDNEYTEDELSLVLAYNVGAQLAVGGRLGRTRRSYSALPVAEFDGTTYRGTIGWRPAPKLILAFEAYKEPRAVLEIDATHVVVRGVRFGPSWAPTMKLVFSAQFVNERRQFQSTADPGLPGRDETLRTWRLGAGWEPRRHFTVGGGLEYGERSSNILGRDYDYTAVMANLRYDF